MDLNTIEAVLTPQHLDEVRPWRDGDAWLAGGTWLFSEPQPGLRRLIDLAGLGWAPTRVTGETFSVAATCTIAELERLDLPPDWRAAPLVGQCCRALLGSFKVRNRATVGGNLCLALPAGPMIALTAALDGACAIRTPGGGERHLSVLDLVRGPRETALAPGEVLTRIDVPVEACRRRAAFRRISLSPDGRSGALVIGTLSAEGAFALTVTASTPRPARVAWSALPEPEALRGGIEAAVAGTGWYDDVHGAPDWRAHVTHVLAREVRQDLASCA